MNRKQTAQSIEAPGWSNYPGLVPYYTLQRNRPEDLYPSERRFLPWLATQGTSVLDVGCAAGGFVNIWRHYQCKISYTGVDVSSQLVDAARDQYPDADFIHGNCATGLPLAAGYATVVQALGWLHWEPSYSEAIRELWRLTGRYLFFDVRLAAESTAAVAGQQQFKFLGDWDGHTAVPYIVVAWPAFASLLLSLQPQSIFGYGYWGKTGDTVVGVQGPVCFATFVLTKGPDRSPTNVCIDSPLAWPPHLVERVQLLPSTELTVLAPTESSTQ